MLRKLWRRDWILACRRHLLLNAAVFAGMLVYFTLQVDSVRVFAIFSALMMTFLPVVLFTKEDMSKAAAAACSLPVTRRDIVRARFTLSWIIMTVGFFLAVAVGAFLPGSKVPHGALLGPEPVFLGLATLTLVSAFILPFVTRFGFLGIVIFLLLLQGIGAVAMLVATAVGGGSGERGPLTNTVELGVGVLVSLRGLTGAVPFYALLCGCLLLVGYAAYRGGLALFLRREF